ncbi:MAG: hypothetical protein ACFFD2_13390 [Promethearchaeota archaeon]
MNKKFESEVRIRIKNINDFLKKLLKFNAKIIYEYIFTDHIYIPKNPTSNWDPNKKIMRIREHILPDNYSRILFTENDIILGKTFQFKQSKYPQGKIELYRGDKKTAKTLLLAWDFQPLYKIEKTDGKLYEIKYNQKFIIAVEAIAQIGYSAEIELWGKNLNTIEREFLEIIDLLGIPITAVTSNTLPYIVAEHLGLVEKN